MLFLELTEIVLSTKMTNWNIIKKKKKLKQITKL